MKGIYVLVCICRQQYVLRNIEKRPFLPNIECTCKTLNFMCVTGWLDDIGLPQYKDQFTEARIDGRMLHCLTVVCVVLHAVIKLSLHKFVLVFLTFKIRIGVSSGHICGRYFLLENLAEARTIHTFYSPKLWWITD